MIDPLGGARPDEQHRRDGRLPLLAPGVLSERQRAVYDALTGGPRGDRRAAPITDRGGRLLGPFNAMLYSPAVGMPLQELGAALRFETAFTGREREIATLVVAAHWRSDFEWHAHERLGRRAGLTEAELTALREGRAPLLADARERVVHEAARQLAAEQDLTDAVHTEAVATLGRTALVELVALVGYYAALALQMRVFRVGVPEGDAPPEWGSEA
ncbi:carboxymuconolactone decarboxylase family protein [Actinomadura hibisca]|uniref:carboxymuconolactone decarboxylase family protein n=1 Tax=Actinomadura hibisca TaxID=68565 RepID=UPI0009FC9337|nr:carboxymuconolactone decarboxylase family protein [Actinomadura hibisca]